MIGARPGTMSGLRRIIAAAMARDLCAFVVPGLDVARAHGLNLVAVGLHLAATPRHANVLLIVGKLPPGLAEAASVAYAQMPRPRAILALGARDIAPLPVADAIGDLSQAGLAAALADLRAVFASGAFAPRVTQFEAPVLQIRIEYTCPMHPEVVSDEPGSCPICGMTLVPGETSASAHAGHAGHGNHAGPAKEAAMPAHAPAMPSASHDHSKHAAAPAQYTCPMHPEVLSDEPGSCPKCGMTLVPVEDTKSGESGHSAHGGHASHGDGSHGGQDHSMHGGHSGHGGGETIAGIEPHFMSMVGLTRDMPASPDGLRMDWIDVPFGPFFPGLPAGLDLNLTLDGDTVVKTRVRSLLNAGPALADRAIPNDLCDRLAALVPLAPVAMRELACRALESAADAQEAPDAAVARAAAVERERIVSHLGWLAGFAGQTGMVWLERRAAALQLVLRASPVDEIARRAGSVRALMSRVRATPLMKAKLAGIGLLDNDASVGGPVGRASGRQEDARARDPVYTALGFAIVTQTGGDALARLHQRCDEIAQSQDLIASAGAIAFPASSYIGKISGEGRAEIETPRGPAQLELSLENGRIASARLTTPFAAQIDLIDGLTAQTELADALTAIGSLDLDPWEVQA
uniref:heavy metal-binding domain-containing protein n=1 Tax=Pararhizobium sp. IMCC3301 TaxID=3067904 RepID=UPI002741DC67|nr:heavy metal-binding domain-containing protein [Pararhizobium sp. IMCC3301]